MTTEIAVLVPTDDSDAAEIFANTLSKSFLSVKRYDKKRLIEELQGALNLMEKYAKLTIHNALKAGAILFAARQRAEYGDWQKFLDKQGIHSKKAERLMAVAMWWPHFPPLNPNTEIPSEWTLYTAYDHLSVVKDTLWQEHGIVAGHGFGPAPKVDGTAEPGATGPKAKKNSKIKRDPKKGLVAIKKRCTALVTSMKKELHGNANTDVLEVISDLQDSLDEITTKWTENAGA